MERPSPRNGGTTLVVTPPPDRLFTPRFFLMCGFTLTVFLSAFQLLPTAPFRVQELGGTPFQSGLFLGLLTYASAFSAPLTGGLADRLGRTRQLVICSLIITGFSAFYAVAPTVFLLLVFVPIHGIAWSGLLAASAAYLTSLVPPSRRGEGIAYWGLASVMAVAIAPPIGFWLYSHGWVWLCLAAAGLNLVMAIIATQLPESARAPDAPAPADHPPHHWIEWRVIALSIPLFLYSYSYGAITSFSAIRADELGVQPKSIYLTTLAVAILASRPLLGRSRRSLRVSARLPSVAGGDHGGIAALDGRTQPCRTRRLGARLRSGLRHRVSRLCRLHHSWRGRRAARRRIWRHPRGVRYRHRHRVHVDGMDRRSRRTGRCVWNSNGVVGAGRAHFSGGRSEVWFQAPRPRTRRHNACWRAASSSRHGARHPAGRVGAKRPLRSMPPRSWTA